MKTRQLLYLILFLPFGVCCAFQEISSDQLVFVEGIGYLKDEQQKTPFTGFVVSYFDNGLKRNQTGYRNGLRHGKDIAWYPDGELKYIARYKSGQLRSQGSRWYAKNNQRLLDTPVMSCFSRHAIEAICGDDGDEQVEALAFMSCHGVDGMEAVCGAEEERPTGYFEFCLDDNC